MHYPFILRYCSSSKSWISPSFGQPVCYIGFLVYLNTDDYRANYERLELLKSIESIICRYDALPHYGKYFQKQRYSFAEKLPKWKDFLNTRYKLDPQGKFMNKFLEELLVAK